MECNARDERTAVRAGTKTLRVCCDVPVSCATQGPASVLAGRAFPTIATDLKDLSRTYQRAFDPKLSARFPHFKKSGYPLGIRFPQGFRIHDKAVYLPKIGWIGFRKSREIEGNTKNVTVSYDGRDWFVTMQTEREVAAPTHPSASAVGIDLGVARFAALSDGSFVEGANAFKKYSRRLALLQLRMSRKRKFSANWRKARSKVLRLHHKIANSRNDALQKASTAISKNHAVVVLEDLRIANMSASAKGNVDQSGINVRAKSGLNRRIRDQAWGEFRRQLGYKLAWNGGTLLLVDPRDTSRTCSACGAVNSENRPTQTAFRCIACSYACNADTNAAVNILRRAGQARIACGDSSLDGSVNQEAQLIARDEWKNPRTLSRGACQPTTYRCGSTVAKRTERV